MFVPKTGCFVVGSDEQVLTRFFVSICGGDLDNLPEIYEARILPENRYYFTHQGLNVEFSAFQTIIIY